MKPGSLAEATLLHVGHVAPGPDWELAWQHHAHHELIVVVRGVTHVTIGKTPLAAGAGEVLFYRAGVPHRERTDPVDVMETYFIGFAWPGLPQAAPLSVVDAGGRLRHLAAWLCEERAAEASESRRLREAPFAALLAEWRRLWHRREDPTTARVHAYIRDHVESPITLADLAGQAGLSRYHFIRTYRRATGHTPMQAVQAMRLEHARDLVLTTDLPMKVVAARAGLGDPCTLCRLFRRRFGAPPSHLRGRRPPTA